MQYIIKPINKFHQALKKIKSKLENIFLSILICIATFTHYKKLASWIEKYVQKNTFKLQQEIIRQKWDLVTLDKASKLIHNKIKVK